MSGSDHKPGRGLATPVSYDVGYGKPAKASRFKAGHPGNPRGRPKGARNKRPGIHEERIKDIVLDEAYRGIAVQDGDRKVTVPMAQAAMRSISVNAAKGNWRCQQLFAELLASTETSRKMLNDQWLEAAIRYELEWEKEPRRRARLGISGLPEPMPHPDHVEIDLDAGTARIIGPRTKEEKADFDTLIANRHELIEELREIHEAREAATDPKVVRRLQKDWDTLLDFIGLVNKLAPRDPDGNAVG